jgi:Mg2+-importing ATPase
MAGAGPGGSEDEGRLISKQDILVLPAAEVLSRMGVTAEAGLSSAEAEERLRTYGTNEVMKRKRTAGAVRFASYFRDPLTLILLFAGLVTLFTGDWASAVVIFIIVLLSTVLRFVQENRADQAAAELSKRVSTTASLTRDGTRVEVPIAQVAPGDIIHLSAGDIVPTGTRVLRCKDLFVDQSALTGESVAAEKNDEALSPDQVGDEGTWTNYLFMGTSVVNGTATGVVVRTGRHTSYAHIVEGLVSRRPETEFERGSRRFGYLIMRVTFVLVVAVFLINALYHRGLLESLLFSVALAVGLTPELLPMILTINLSKGAMDMSHEGVVVKRLESIQNYGSMDTLCTDKTGTLTENKVALVQYVSIDGSPSDRVLELSFINSHFETGLKSQLDKAIIDHGGASAEGYELLEEVPFDFQRRRVSVIVRHDGEALMITKGEPESMLRASARYETDGKELPLDEDARRSILDLNDRLSRDGLRLLGVAWKEVEATADFGRDDERGMTFAGFVAFLDPPKQSAREALEMLRRSHIDLKIITGDSELVTRKVCRELGFDIRGVVLGRELEGMGDEEKRRAVERANIFARVNPDQKTQIIQLLKGNGHVVGYLGDGINDAPSIRAADVGISVDNAVDVAKEAADIILLKNDLRVLQKGVVEGRRTFGNTMKYIQMGISSNFGNMFSAAAASLFLSFLPMLPLQILLNNLLYDLSETAIPTDNVDREYTESAKKLDIRYIRDFMLFFGPLSSVFDILTFLVLIVVFHASGGLFQTAWFVESVCTQTLVVFAIRTRRVPFFRSRPSTTLVLTSLVVVAFALLVPFSPISGPFRFVHLPPEFYIFLALFVAGYLLLIEVLKMWFYRRHVLEQRPVEEGKPT